MASTLPKLPIFEAIASHDPKSTVVIHSESGRRFTYGELLQDVAEAKDKLHKEAGSDNIDGQRIAFLVENGYDYVGAQHNFSVAYYLAMQLVLTMSSYLTIYSGCTLNRSSSIPRFSGA
jgi:hypothetical protein